MTLAYYNPQHWRDRATEMRALSETTKDVEATAIMLRLADIYDELADRAEMRSNGVPPGGNGGDAMHVARGIQNPEQMPGLSLFSVERVTRYSGRTLSGSQRDAGSLRRNRTTTSMRTIS